MRCLLCLLLLGGCDSLLSKKPAPDPPAPACPSADPVGRYQLFQGTLQVHYESGPAPEPVIIRIDTATGKTWEYIRHYNKQKKEMRDFWSEF